MTDEKGYLEMGIAAFLCGLFYGAFFLSVHQKAERARYVRELEERVPVLDEECACDECCGCYSTADLEPIVPGVTFPNIVGPDGDLSKVIRTGYEDG